MYLAYFFVYVSFLPFEFICLFAISRECKFGNCLCSLCVCVFYLFVQKEFILWQIGLKLRILSLPCELCDWI